MQTAYAAAVSWLLSTLNVFGRLGLAISLFRVQGLGHRVEGSGFWGAKYTSTSGARCFLTFRLRHDTPQ